MSLFSFDSGVCRNCKKNGKCEEQKAISKGLSQLVNRVNVDHSDNSVVGTIVVTCNRGGE
jgi:hypothetical protein